MGVVGLTETQYFGRQVRGEKLIQRSAEVHALDAYPDLVDTVAVAVKANPVEALLAVGLVVEPATGACLGQPYSANLLELHAATVREPVGGSRSGDACGDILCLGLGGALSEGELDRVDGGLAVVQRIE